MVLVDLVLLVSTGDGEVILCRRLVSDELWELVEPATAAGSAGPDRQATGVGSCHACRDRVRFEDGHQL